MADRRAARSRRTNAGPRFFFALDCPLSYLMAERVERALGEITWIAVIGPLYESNGPAGWADRERRVAVRMRAAAHAARILQIPLIQPDPSPLDSRRAARAAMFAAEADACQPFALAMARMAFCGGFDIRDDTVIAEAAAVARLDPKAVMAAASDTRFDSELDLSSRALAACRVDAPPAINIGNSWFEGADAILAALSFRTAHPYAGSGRAPIIG